VRGGGPVAAGWVGDLFFSYNGFSITEIEVEGSVGAIPEPSAALLFGFGFGIVGIATKRRR